MFSVGQRVGDYEVLNIVGAGGMGCVYRVRNVISERIEAMKVLLADLQAEPDLATRFLSEIRTLATLDHPNIAQLHTALQLGNELVMIMEFVEGMTLQQMAQQEPLPHKKVINYAHQVLAALSFAHSRGVVHRDIKPANVIVTPQGSIKLTDFGIAKSKAITELTQPGTTMGSLHYMSPEQARGGQAIDGRCDIYSLGITMYELLAGCLPFADESAYVLLHNHLNDTPRPPIELNPRLSKALNDVILKALEKDPAKRFQCAATFSDALERATGIASTVAMDRSPLPGQAASAVAPGSRSSGVQATSKHLTFAERRRWVFTRASAGVIVLAGAAYGFTHIDRSGVMVKAATLAGKPALPTSPFLTASTPRPTAPPASRALVTSSPEVGTVIEETRPAVNRRLLARETPIAPVSVRKTRDIDSDPRVQDDPADKKIAVKSSPEPQALKDLRMQKAELETKVATIRASVQRLKSQREAEGDGLDAAVAGAYVRMNAYLSAENADLEESDVVAARGHMAEAVAQLNILQGLFADSSNTAKR